MQQRLQLDDLIYIDDCGTMDAYEAELIKTILDAAQ
jgi:hypothetical protein